MKNMMIRSPCMTGSLTYPFSKHPAYIVHVYGVSHVLYALEMLWKLQLLLLIGKIGLFD